MKNFAEYKKDLALLISAKSVEDNKTDTAFGFAPFGEQTAKCLKDFLDIAKRMGFQTKNYDNYMGEVCVGSGEEVGIIGHLDVVPAGNEGWDSPPFTLTEKDGFLIGRGVNDDKGPLLACLYAIKELVDQGVNFNRKIRLFVGTNEETGWKDVEYFNSVCAFPEFGFSPDGNFPLSYAEKGIFPTTFTLNNLKLFSEINGGHALNAVCDFVTATPTFIPNANDLIKFGLSFEDGKIVSRGKTAHGSRPDKGVNAIKPLLEYATYLGEDLSSIVNELFNDGLGLSQMKNEQGQTTISPNLIKSTEQGLQIVCDVRVPYPFTMLDLKKRLDRASAPYSVEERHPPVCTPKDGWLVKTLIGAYNSVTGESALPVAMSGSTFARAFKYGCSFGPTFPNSPSVAHQPNERLSIEEILQSFAIYKLAIKNLVE